MPRIIRRTDSIAANSTVTNVLSVEQFATLIDPSRIRVGMVASAAGLEASVNIGGELAVQNAVLAVESGTGVGVNDDDLPIAIAAGLEGDEIQASVTNTTAGALTAYTYVLIEETGE